MWPGSYSPFIEHAIWTQNSAMPRESESWEEARARLAGRSCIGTLDLSGKNALSSLTLMFDEEELPGT